MKKFEQEECVVVLKVDEKRTGEICKVISKINSELLELQKLLNELPIDIEYKNLNKLTKLLKNY